MAVGLVVHRDVMSGVRNSTPVYKLSREHFVRMQGMSPITCSPVTRNVTPSGITVLNGFQECGQSVK